MGSEALVPIPDAIERVNIQTGEVVEHARDFSGYAGVATVAVTVEQARELMEILPDDAHDVLPTGEVYVSQVHYRRLLNRIFGPGGWALIPRGAFAMQANTITREYALVGPGGRFISEAIGEAEYQPNNPRMTYASACEAVKSNALTRCCKDLGIASECWDKRFCEQFKRDWCVKVWRTSQRQPQWRRKDAEPWFDEKHDGQVPPAAPEAASRPAPTNGGNGHTTLTKPHCPHCGGTEKVIVGKFPDKKRGVEKPWYCLACKFSWGDSTKPIVPDEEPWEPGADEEQAQ